MNSKIGSTWQHLPHCSNACVTHGAPPVLGVLDVGANTDSLTNADGSVCWSGGDGWQWGGCGWLRVFWLLHLTHTVQPAFLGDGVIAECVTALCFSAYLLAIENPVENPNIRGQLGTKQDVPGETFFSLLISFPLKNFPGLRIADHTGSFATVAVLLPWRFQVLAVHQRCLVAPTFDLIQCESIRASLVGPSCLQSSHEAKLTASHVSSLDVPTVVADWLLAIAIVEKHDPLVGVVSAQGEVVLDFLMKGFRHCQIPSTEDWSGYSVLVLAFEVL